MNHRLLEEMITDINALFLGPPVDGWVSINTISAFMTGVTPTASVYKKSRPSEPLSDEVAHLDNGLLYITLGEIGLAELSVPVREKYVVSVKASL